MGANASGLSSKDKKGQSVTVDLSEKPLEKWIQDAKKANILKNIERLDLSRQELSELSPQIAKFPNLKVLQIYDNVLKSIPPEIGKLSNLNALGLNENSLTELPPEIGQLQNLVMLVSYLMMWL